MLDSYFTQHQHMHGRQFQTAPTTGIQWPSARDHPLFYVGIYAAIGLCSTLASLISAATQYTGALRASRLLFK